MSEGQTKNTNQSKKENPIETTSPSLFRNKADIRTIFIICFTWFIFCINWFIVYEITNLSNY